MKVDTTAGNLIAQLDIEFHWTEGVGFHDQDDSVGTAVEALRRTAGVSAIENTNFDRRGTGWNFTFVGDTDDLEAMVATLSCLAGAYCTVYCDECGKDVRDDECSC